MESTKSYSCHNKNNNIAVGVQSTVRLGTSQFSYLHSVSLEGVHNNKKNNKTNSILCIVYCKRVRGSTNTTQGGRHHLDYSTSFPKVPTLPVTVTIPIHNDSV